MLRQELSREEARSKSVVAGYGSAASSTNPELSHRSSFDSRITSYQQQRQQKQQQQQQRQQQQQEAEEEGDDDEEEEGAESEEEEDEEEEDEFEEDEDSNSTSSSSTSSEEQLGLVHDNNRRRRNLRRHNNDNNDDDDAEDASQRRSSSNKWRKRMWKKWVSKPLKRAYRKKCSPRIRKPIRALLSPFRKVWTIAHEAIVLISNVDNVWDSPALQYQTPLIVQQQPQQPPQSQSVNASYYGGSNSSVGTRGNTEMSISTVSRRGSNLLLQGGGDIPHHHSPHMRTVTTRHKLGVLFWFLVLATAYATERSSFKLFVDRMGPFRLFGAEAITGVHALVLGSWMIIVGLRRRDWASIWGKVGIPLADIGLMAILDTIHLLLVVISGSHVAPILTVILVQFTIPLTSAITQFTHPDGRYHGMCCHLTVPPPSPLAAQETTENEVGRSSNASTTTPQTASTNAAIANNNGSENTIGWGGLTHQHIFGSILILISVILGLGPAVLTLIYPCVFNADDLMPDSTAWSTIIFTLSCIPAAASQLYKEHVLIQFKQPVHPNRLNLLLSIFQCLFAAIISPLFYSLQGLGDGNEHYNNGEGGDTITTTQWWTLYPSTQMKANFYDGLKCICGGMLDDTVQVRGYAEEAHCDFAWGIVLVHVWSILTVGFAVDKIVHAGATKIMYRGISAGIMLGILLMLLYQVLNDDMNYGFIAHSWQISCAAILIMGSEVYHRVSLQEPTFETVYPEPGNLYEDDDS